MPVLQRQHDEFGAKVVGIGKKVEAAKARLAQCSQELAAAESTAVATLERQRSALLDQVACPVCRKPLDAARLEQLRLMWSRAGGVGAAAGQAVASAGQGAGEADEELTAEDLAWLAEYAALQAKRCGEFISSARKMRPSVPPPAPAVTSAAGTPGTPSPPPMPMPCVSHGKAGKATSSPAPSQASPASAGSGGGSAVEAQTHGRRGGKKRNRRRGKKGATSGQAAPAANGKCHVKL